LLKLKEDRSAPDGVRTVPTSELLPGDK